MIAARRAGGHGVAEIMEAVALGRGQPSIPMALLKGLGLLRGHRQRRVGRSRGAHRAVRVGHRRAARARAEAEPRPRSRARRRRHRGRVRRRLRRAHRRGTVRPRGRHGPARARGPRSRSWSRRPCRRTSRGWRSARRPCTGCAPSASSRRASSRCTRSWARSPGSSGPSSWRRSTGESASRVAPRFPRPVLGVLGGLLVGLLAARLPEVCGNGSEAIALMLDGRVALRHAGDPARREAAGDGDVGVVGQPRRRLHACALPRRGARRASSAPRAERSRRRRSSSAPFREATRSWAWPASPRRRRTRR